MQMIDVGEETGRLDEMLLKVAEIEERHMRAQHQDPDLPAGAGVDLGGRGAGGIHGHCAACCPFSR